MDHMITAVINGKERYLNYSVEIMFKVIEKFGGINQTLDAIGQITREGFENLRWFVVELANDGELCRRDAGYDHEPMLTMDEISLRMTPIEHALLLARVIKAVNVGYGHEIESEEEVDLGLAELNEKKAPAGA